MGMVHKGVLVGFLLCFLQIHLGLALDQLESDASSV